MGKDDEKVNRLKDEGRQRNRHDGSMLIKTSGERTITNPVQLRQRTDSGLEYQEDCLSRSILPFTRHFPPRCNITSNLTTCNTREEGERKEE